jgi:hypothetical protein
VTESSSAKTRITVKKNRRKDFRSRITEINIRTIKPIPSKILKKKQSLALERIITAHVIHFITLDKFLTFSSLPNEIMRVRAAKIKKRRMSKIFQKFKK